MNRTYVEERENALWVAGTRVSLDSIVYAYRQGHSPENITEHYPAATLEQVYGAITFYLAHRDEVDAYLREGEALAEALRGETHAKNAPLVEKVRAARGADGPLKIRFQADADLDHAIITGLKRRQPLIEFATLAEGGILDLLDDEVLSVTARQGRLLVSHDQRTMPRHFARFIEENESPGVLLTLQGRPVSEAIEELLLIWTATEAEEWVNRIVVLPL